MSDDEGDDIGDYEDLDGGLDLTEDGPDPQKDDESDDADADAASADSDAETAAAGTDDEADDEAGDDALDRGEAPSASKARPERARTDPVLLASNKSRTVHVVPPDERVTDNRLHKTEMAYVLAVRAEQIAKNAKCFTATGDLHDPVALAAKELYDRRCPLRIRRQIGTSSAGDPIVEEWPVREMTLPPQTLPFRLGPSPK